MKSIQQRIKEIELQNGIDVGVVSTIYFTQVILHSFIREKTIEIVTFYMLKTM